MSVEQYSYDPHLREEDAQLFHHDARSWQPKHLQARDDIVRDLKRRGYIDYESLDYTDHGLYFHGEVTGTVIDDSATASVDLQFSADANGPLNVPKGTRVYDADPSVADKKAGAVVFTTDAALSVPKSGSDTVAATAEHPGEPYNVPAGALTHIDASLSNFDAVTNPAAASEGADHQLALLSTYRALGLIYRDLGVQQGDTFDYKRGLYEEAYDEELERMIASGIKIDLDGDGTQDAGEEDLEHGGIRLHRS